MNLKQNVRAEALRWTGQNPIEFLDWISKQGISWQYCEDDSFMVGMVDDSEFSDSLAIGDILLVVKPSVVLDFACPFVYSSVKQMERDGWSYDE